MTSTGRNASIISGHFSGSTLLSILLGNHPDAESIGELNLLMRFSQKKQNCSCGRSLVACPLWGGVLPEFHPSRGDEPLLFIDTAQLVQTSGSRAMARTCQLAALVTNPRLHRACFGLLGPGGDLLRRTAADLAALMEGVRRVSRRSIVIDSSKGALTARLSFLAAPEKFRAIHLVRDGRAVAESWMRKAGWETERAAMAWLNAYRSHMVSLRRLPQSQRLFLRYEDLCTNPEGELQRVCSFLDISYDRSMLDLATREIHNVAGNPMRHDGRRQEIKLDQGWRERLTKNDRSTLERVLGRANRRFGYA